LCFGTGPAIDGSGTAAFPGGPTSSALMAGLSVIPASGTGSVIASATSPIWQMLALPSGFEIGAGPSADNLAFRLIGPDGSDQGPGKNPNQPVGDFIPNPLGGYLETQQVIENDKLGSNGLPLSRYDVRWVDAYLEPATPWVTVLEWNYENIYFTVLVDAKGSALILQSGSYPMTMPCQGDDTAGYWLSPSGTLTAFRPISPTYLSQSCSEPQFAGFGKPFALPDGGFAFYVKPFAGLQFTMSGWYAYASGATFSPAPAWLLPYDGSVQALSNGAYLALRHDPADCSRTADILGPAGQVCATVPLESSSGCDADDLLTPDGTLVLHETYMCPSVWWPHLGEP
jgi:hypothetical protein